MVNLHFVKLIFAIITMPNIYQINKSLITLPSNLVCCFITLVTYLFLIISINSHSYAQNNNNIEQQRIEASQEKIRRILLNTNNHRNNKNYIGVNLEQLKQQNKDSPTQAEHSIVIRKIKIVGYHVLPATFFDTLIKNHQGKSLTAPIVNNILRSITNQYITLGYITSRAYLPEQDLSTGTLQINIVEGKVKQILTTGRKSLYIGNIFTDINQKVLNIRNIEQGIDQLNKLKSNRAKINLLPAREQGFSLLKIDNPYSKRWLLNFGINNFGQTSTGRFQATTTLSLDHSLLLNENMQFSHTVDPTGRGDGGFNEVYAWQITVPIERYTLSASASYSSYLATSTATGTSFRSTGNSTYLGVNLERLLFRNQLTKMNAGIAYSFKRNKNFLDTVLLTTSSRSISGFEIYGDYTRYTNQGSGVLYAKLSCKFGVPLFGSFDNELSQVSATARYATFHFDCSYNRAFSYRSVNSSYTCHLSTQYSNQNLFAAQSFNLGGFSSVHGFRDESSISSSGVFLKQELTADVIKIDKIAGKLQLYLAHTIGSTFGPHTFLDTHKPLQGMSFGLRTIAKRGIIDVGIYLPLSKPTAISENSPLFGFTTRISL